MRARNQEYIRIPSKASHNEIRENDKTDTKFHLYHNKLYDVLKKLQSYKIERFEKILHKNKYLHNYILIILSHVKISYV